MVKRHATKRNFKGDLKESKAKLSEQTNYRHTNAKAEKKRI